MNKTKKKIVADSTFLLVSDVLLKLKGIIFLPLIISKVGIENYGIFIQVLINPGVIAALFSMSLGSNFTRFTSKFSDENRDQISKDFFTVICFGFLFSIIGALILFFLSEPISEYILSGKSEDIIRLSSLIVINEVMWRNFGFFLKSRKKFKLFSILILLYQLLPYLGFVTGILLYSDIFRGMQFFVFIQILFNLLIFISLAKNLDFALPSFNRFKKFISYSWALSTSNITGGLLAKSDRYFIGYFMGPSAIGLYSILYMILSFIDQITVPFRNYFGSYLPKIWDSGNKSKALEQIRIGLIIYLTTGIYLLGISILYLKDFLLLFVNLDFMEVEHYNLTIIAIGLGVLFLGFNRFYEEIITLSRKNHFLLIAQFIGLTVNTILNFILLPKFGFLGAGISTFAGYLLVLIIYSYYFRIPIKRKFTILQIIAITVSLVAMLLTATNMISDSFLYFSLSLFASTIIFFVSLFLLITIFRVNEIFKLKNVL